MCRREKHRKGETKTGVKRCPPPPPPKTNSGSHYCHLVLRLSLVLPVVENANEDSCVSHILLFFSWRRAKEWSRDPNSFLIPEQKQGSTSALKA